ncbi:MAG: regulatory iron-sulfur-containing complex subunit RicT [Bacilli bacterium]
MNYYIYVRFNEGGKGYTFATNFENLKEGDLVVVETIKGLEIGTVCSDLFSMDLYKSDLELKPIIRVAGASDLQTLKDNRERAIKASAVFTAEAEKLNLDMKLVDCEYTLDISKVIFSYLADDRIDFRELLKRLASLLHCRIELKQIGARDKAKIVGGIGICGLQLCCNLFLNEFNGISINKAKNQMLAINIPKISGQCGKLMCCLKFEDDLYTEEKQKFPEAGTKVRYENKDYYTSSFNILSKNIKLDSGDGVVIYLSLDQVKAAIEKEKQPKPKEPISKDQNQYRRKQR